MAIESTAKHIIPGSPLSTVLSENKGNPITVNTTAGSSVSGQFTDYTASYLVITTAPSTTLYVMVEEIVSFSFS
ncbi:DUF2642 domain-containing protein [Paenibacillus sp. FSL H8-0537]|uniref:DUF2642 domain-containing protein n=1 Tax=Paenibacillus sp. FSL H8-0537 TaxID=2921399 RepID=UPI0031016D15